MAAQPGCRCQSCTVRGYTGPAIVITIGVLFLLHQTHGGVFYFGHTWPVILVVIGLIQLASAMASREGHIEPTVIPGVPPPPAPPMPPMPPATGSEPPFTPSGR